MSEIRLSKLKPVALSKFTPFQRKWIAALTSGKFRQTKNQLTRRRSHCCLGLACHILREPLDLKVSEAAITAGGTVYNGDMYRLPDKVKRALGMHAVCGGLKGEADGDDGFSGDCLAELNDDYGFKFTDIAKLLRRAPWMVFTNFKRPKNVKVIVLEKK